MNHVAAFVQAREENAAALGGIPMDALKEKLLAIFRPAMNGANHYGPLK